MNTLATPFRFARRRSAIPYLVLVVGVLATATGAFYSDRAAREQDQIRFDGAVDHVAASITNRVDTYVALLRAGAGLFAASHDVSGPEFEEFVSRLDLRRGYPGIQGIGFAMHVRAADLAGFAEKIRAGRPDFHVWPDTPREDYFPIIFLEPADRRNLAAIGYDMFTEPVRRAAMLRAARSGTAATSGKVTLVQEIDPQKQAGFLIYAPVYTGGGIIPDNVDERLDRLRGFIYSPFRAGDFLSSVFARDNEPLVDIAVYDGTMADPGELLYDSPRGDGRRAGRFMASTRLEIAGRPWLVIVRSLPEFEHGEGRLVPWILAIGLVVTLALALATREEVRARAEAELAAERLRVSEEALRESETKLRQLVDAERRAHAEAAAASRAKDDFLATLSHELRTPLNAILGWSSMLRSGRLSEAQRGRALEVIARSAKTQADLIEDLLDVSRIITGKLAIDTRPIRLAGPVQAALDAVRPTAEAKGVRLERHLDPDTPVLGDPDRLQQVAWNLLSNAIKFTPEGGRVTASLRRLGGQAELRVSDTGRGIAPTFLPHVFERFRQHDSSTTRLHGGMGLGLAIVRHLVEAHGGEVHAESAGEGRGAAFVVRLPLRSEAAPAPSGSVARQLLKHPGRDLSGLRALVVDDDRDSRDLIAEVLATSGADVVTAATAAEALLLLDQERVDILLADIAMPGTDGYQLMRDIRTHRSEAVRGIPAIAVTAYARDQDRDLALRAGFQEHLAKPVDVEALHDAVRRLALSHG